MKEIINLIQTIINTPYVFTFALLFLMGYILKEKTNFDNKSIPIALALASLIIGTLIIQFSIKGALAGLLIGMTIIATYDIIKPVLKKAAQSWVAAWLKNIISR